MTKHNGYFTFQTIIDIAGARGAFSDVVCVDSPVIIKLFTKKVNKQVHKKIWNFQLEYRDHSTSIKSTETSWSNP